MFFRKVIKQGHNTLTITLPNSWVKSKNISAGDEIILDFDDKNNLIISTQKIKEKNQTIKINIDKWNYLTLSNYLTELYRNNYKKITLEYSTNKIYYHKKDSYINLDITIAKIVNRLLGAEIISQTPNKTEIECFLEINNADLKNPDKKKELEKIEKRIFYLLKETLNELLNSLNNIQKFQEYNKNVYTYHDNIVKFINYYLRALYSSEKSDHYKKIAYSFYSVLDNLVDKIRYICDMVSKFKCSKTAKKFIADFTNLYLDFYHDLIFENIIKSENLDRRYILKKNLESSKITSREMQVIKEAYFFIEFIKQITEYNLVREQFN